MSFWFKRAAARFGVALAIALALTAFCLVTREPVHRSLEDLEREYVEFIDAEINPLAERDKLTHLAGGCDVGPDDFICVECYLPGGEVWVRCSSRHGCVLLDTWPELDGSGADLGICERPEVRQGLAIAFQRRRP